MSQNKTILLLLSVFGLTLGGCGAVMGTQSSIADQANYTNETNETIGHNPSNLIPTPPFNAACDAPEPENTYRLGAQDAINIDIFKEDNLSGKYTIDTNGFITMPLIGELQLSGCSLSQASNIIESAYMDGYLVDPNVSIKVAQYKPFYIIGEVRTPGEYDFAIGTTVLKAVAIAGGFTYRANKKNVEILRHDTSNLPYYSDHSLEGMIKPGDVVIIKERFF